MLRSLDTVLSLAGWAAAPPHVGTQNRGTRSVGVPALFHLVLAVCREPLARVCGSVKHFSFLRFGVPLLAEAREAPWMWISCYFQEPGNQHWCVGRLRSRFSS